jgi:hypothetical protein
MAEPVTIAQLVEIFAQGVAEQESWYKSTRRLPSVSRRLNNPGCLTHWMDSRGNPYPVNNGYVEFPTEEEGWKALRSQVRINIVKRGLTFREFFAGRRTREGRYEGFRPSHRGGSPLTDAGALAKYVSSKLGLGTATPIDTRVSTLAVLP